MYYFKRTPTRNKSIIKFKIIKNMKLRNLFLVGLAAMAMTSCSNENDPIENGGGNAEAKNAVMQFRFAYNAPVATKAYSDADGLDKEQTFTKALLVVAYTNGTTNAIAKEITRAEFTPTADPADEGKYYQSVPFEVTAGTVKAYVILNPEQAMSTALLAFNDQVKSVAEVETALKGLTSSTFPNAANSFIMYGKQLGENNNGVSLAEKATTTLTVTVDRIAAKLKEETSADNITKNVTQTATGQTLGSTVSVSLQGYVYTNLTSSSNLVYQNDKKVTAFTPASLFTGTHRLDFSYSAMGAPADDGQITYCFENENEDTHANGTGITSIIYKAKITATDINDKDATKNANVYIMDKVVYSYKTLKDAFPGLTLTDDDSAEKFQEINIYKYEGGVCYYRKAISTNQNANIIVRNNLYKLSVSNITKIGFPTTIPAADKTMMKLDLVVNDWTVNSNSFEL